MLAKGRRQGKSLRKTNTIKPKSAEQGMLINQDSILDYLNAVAAAIAASTSGTDLQSGLFAITAKVPSKLKLRD